MKAITLFYLCLLLAGGALASPGAHGPNGEHLDGPVGASVAGNVPRTEAFSDMFELVGQLSGGEFSVMIDRYDTNEPVLNGKLEVEFKGMKAIAKFHPDMGDYAIEDEKFVKALSAPGKHALIFTFIAGDESDLLEGTLVTQAEVADHHDHGPNWKWIAAGGLAVLGVAAAFVIYRRNRKAMA